MVAVAWVTGRTLAALCRGNGVSRSGCGGGSFSFCGILVTFPAAADRPVVLLVMQ